jgi:GNAT superfamily N-acetyltransferase
VNPPKLIEEGLRGQAYLDRVTDLLVRARAEDPEGGPWDAADLQWWSRSGRYDDNQRLRFWSEPNTPSKICALFPTVGTTMVCNCLWTPSAREVALSWVVPGVLSKVQAMAQRDRLSVEVDALEEDTEWRQFLERRGFELVTGGSAQGVLRISDPADPSWVEKGLRICDDTQRSPNQPHPLAKRCGPEIHRGLQGCSMYRPDLDLSVQTVDGEVVAYCICWADFKNRFAMLEPMRTESAWQRRGLAAALIAEQARRLNGLGIESIKVNYDMHNPAAARLYERSKFVLRFKRVAYRWPAPDGAASV